DESLSQVGRSGVRILGATPEEREKLDDILSKLPRADRDAIQFVAMADENLATFVEGDNKVQVRNTSVEMSGMDPSDPKNRGQIVLIRSQFASPIGTAVFLEELGHAVDFAYGITADKTGPWGQPPFLNPQISERIEDFAYSYMAYHGDKFQDSVLQNLAEHIRTKMPEKFAAIQEHEDNPGEMMDNKIHGSGGPFWWWR
ncbi:MAG: hypothetical protein HYU64_07380, partial [Armatimonadetes bacterium]|nr:hypothetical protein [Armatimonadota bacterium]